jgi:hypothetical protein
MQPLVLCPTQYEASRVKTVARARGAVLQVIGVGCGCEAAIRSVAAAHAGERWVFLVGIAGLTCVKPGRFGVVISPLSERYWCVIDVTWRNALRNVALRPSSEAETNSHYENPCV